MMEMHDMYPSPGIQHSRQERCRGLEADAEMETNDPAAFVITSQDELEDSCDSHIITSVGVSELSNWQAVLLVCCRLYLS